ncbi:MAG TPA: EAL domain-containing protein [Rhodocyclaceae bacterium]
MKAGDVGDPRPAPPDAARRLELVVESIRDGLLAVDRQWRIDLVNRCAADMLGRRREALLHADFRQAMEAAVVEGVRQVMEKRQPLSFEHFSNADGRWHDYRLSPSEDGGAVVFFADITERKLASERALLVAQHDSLTGLANRRLLREEAERILAAARRQGQRAAVLFLDLDRFKPVNDAHGHEVGDKLLKSVARRIRRQLRTEDAIGRIGGDEFVVVLVGIRDAADAGRVAANMVARLGRPYRIGSLTLEVGASIGISLFPEHGDSVDALFKRADAAMYRVKRSGRGRFAIFDPAIEAAAPAGEAGMAEQLRAALAAGEFSLDFQPVFASATADVAAAEALIRWQRPDGSQIPPADFLPIAEATGLIHAIGEWQLREACAQQRRWAAEGMDGIAVGITVAGAQFRAPGFAQRVAAIAAESGVDPARLILNVAEEAVAGNVDESARILQELRDAGIAVAIKNFGAGESDVRALARLPVDKIRLDRSFLRPASGAATHAGAGNGHAAADAIIGLGHSLRHEVIAEGVEREADVEYLRGRGVEYWQGFLLGGPMPAAEFAAWWRHRRSAAVHVERK